MSTSIATPVARVIQALGDCVERSSIVYQANDRAKLYVTDVQQFHDRLPKIEDELHVDIHCIVSLASDRAQLYVKPRS